MTTMILEDKKKSYRVKYKESGAGERTAGDTDQDYREKE